MPAVLITYTGAELFPLYKTILVVETLVKFYIHKVISTIWMSDVMKFPQEIIFHSLAWTN